MDLFSETEYKLATFRTLLRGKCDCCGKEIMLPKRQFYKQRKEKRKICCSFACRNNSWQKNKGFYNPQKVSCDQCGRVFYKKNANIKRTKNNFCSQSCSGTYHNAHKTRGTRRSKLEIWLEKQLTKLYPNLEIHYNRKDTISSELDIYIPSLKLAFELNGIFHYEPVFGEGQLSKVQNNDNRKFQTCLEQKIQLCIIDVSQLKYFKEQNAQKYLDIIIKIIGEATGT